MSTNIRSLSVSICLFVAACILCTLSLGHAQRTAYASVPPSGFTDVQPGDWFYEDVMALAERNLMTGYPDRTFKPDASIRVDEFVKILLSALGESVEPSTSGYWAEEIIAAAVEHGIIHEGEFSTCTRKITRGEMARMILRAAELGGNPKWHLVVPDNYLDYALLLTDLDQLSHDEQDLALRIFTAGIITGTADNSFNYHAPASRAEAGVIMMRFLEPERRIIPDLPEVVDMSSTLTVEEFVTQLLQTLGKTASMDAAFKQGYVRYEAEYPSFHKPILRREAALTMARVLDDLTGITSLFTSGDNDLFVEGRTLNHRIQPGQVDGLMKVLGVEGYFLLSEWQDYRGHIKDIHKVTEEYQKEMVTLYLAGVIDLIDGELRPYDFLTKEDAGQWLEAFKTFVSLDEAEVLAKLKETLRYLDKRPMPEPAQPSNAERWRNIYPYVSKTLYEYPLNDSNYYISNAEMRTSVLNTFNQVHKNFFNTRYNVDYRCLDCIAPYYSTYNHERGLGNYQERLLFFYNPAHVYNHEEKDESKWILPDDRVRELIEEIKKHKVVMQSEFITDHSLIYYGGTTIGRGTMRFIFYPPTDPKYLKSKGLELGKWYEVDIEVYMTASVDGPAKYRDRWPNSVLGTPYYSQLGSIRAME